MARKKINSYTHPLGRMSCIPVKANAIQFSEYDWKTNEDGNLSGLEGESKKHVKLLTIMLFIAVSHTLTRILM